MNGLQFVWKILNTVQTTGLVVVVAILVLRFGLTWFQRTRPRRKPRIQVLEVIPLDQQQHLALVQVRQRVLLIGFGSGHVALLTEWSGNNRMAASKMKKDDTSCNPPRSRGRSIHTEAEPDES